MSQPFLGEIKIFGGNFAPRGFAFCAGQLLSIAQNDALFMLIGTTYGGDGQSTFGLPDLRGRLPIHQGSGPGLTGRTLGEAAGTETETLTTAQVPTHTHALQASSKPATTSTPGNSVVLGQTTGGELYAIPPAAPDATLAAASVSSAGGSQPHNNLQPYLGLSFVIALEGIFPSPN